MFTYTILLSKCSLRKLTLKHGAPIQFSVASLELAISFVGKDWATLTTNDITINILRFRNLARLSVITLVLN